MNSAARVLLADDHALVRAGVRRILEDTPGLTIVAEAADGEEALRRALAGGIDLAVLDVSMPKLTGLHVARHLSEHRPDVRVLILSMHDIRITLTTSMTARPPASATTRPFAGSTMSTTHAATSTQAFGTKRRQNSGISGRSPPSP